jgi:hypothetical protein
LVVVVVVDVALPAGVSTLVDFVVSVVVVELGGGDTLTVVLEVVLSAGFSLTMVVEDVVPDDPDGVTSALQPAMATATSAARA